MIVKEIFCFVFTKRLEKSSDHVNWRWLKQQKFIFLNLPNFGTYFTIEREKKSIIVLIRSNKSIRIFPKIASCWFIEDIISDNIILTLEVLDNFEPHFDELIIHSIFIREEIVRETNNIIRYIVFEEWHFQAVLFERITVFVPPKIYFEWRRKTE